MAQKVPPLAKMAGRTDQSKSDSKPDRGRLLVTGSSGLVGSALTRLLAESGYAVQAYDLRDDDGQDILRPKELAAKMHGCKGVIHLAAVSRVVWGENDPARCRTVNVDGLANVLQAASQASPKPWLLFTSSREVYGRRKELPVAEDALLRPVNVYGHTKLQGEALVSSARQAGLRTATIRLSNVFGSADDHADRVVPAFVRAALARRPLRVDGRGNTFDFTFVDDVALGLRRVVQLLDRGRRDLPVLHLASGWGTTLGQLAELVLALTDSGSALVDAPKRDFDVDQFVGDPSRAASVLGWRHSTTLEDGLRVLIDAFRERLHTHDQHGARQ
jgi:UDP-glucose 4-epimerase